MKERTHAAANYIISYFNEIQQLNQTYADYVNVLIELKSKYDFNIIEELKIEDYEKSVLQRILQILRAAVVKTHILYQSIYSAARIDLNDEFTKLYANIKDTYVMPVDKVEEYVIKANMSLTHDIIAHMLSDSQSMMAEIYAKHGQEQDRSKDVSSN